MSFVFPPRRQTQNGFTLIELLVVIAIIALLAAILFPVFGRARENSRRSSCQSNLKQIGLGLMQYSQDFDGWTPGSVINNVSWPSLVFPYMGGDGIFACPSGALQQRSVDYVTPVDNYQGTTGNDGSTASLRKVNNGLSYAMNLIQTGASSGGSNGWRTANFQGTIATPGIYGPKSGFINIGATASIGLFEVQVEDPSGTIRIFDAMATTNSGTSIRSISAEDRTDIHVLNTSSKATKRHFEGFNALYGDGHVKWRRYGSTTPNEWSIQSDNSDGTAK
ncbi:MAG TPA: DUF1559 domain-containing protein [Abditibacterium sp.]|jgi:prepilin-type N-terminal cleavage/methylation domain-containing protein/prepilin-type processing-associated H-X9-DG protein